MSNRELRVSSFVLAILVLGAACSSGGASSGGSSTTTLPISGDTTSSSPTTIPGGYAKIASLLLTNEGVLKVCGFGEPPWLSPTVTDEEPPDAVTDVLTLANIAREWAAPATRRAASTRRWMPWARCAGTACATASRAISWRNRSPVPSSVSRPPATSSSRTAGGQPVTDASSPGSTRVPVSAAASSTSRARPPSRAARASTASRADTGTAAVPARSTSVR